MLKPITFTIEAESGPLTVTASGLDYAAYEDRFDRSANFGVMEYRYVAWVFICWHAMHRQKLTELTYEEFLDSTPEVHREVKVEEPVPLERTPTTGG